MKDGLYINGRWVDDAEEIKLTLQGNDLTKPATMQTSYGDSAKLPDNLLVRSVTQGAESTGSGSDFVYQKQKAFLIRGGQVIFDGLVRFNQFSAGWDINLLELKKSLYDSLNESIKKTNLNAYDFIWSEQTINKANDGKEGVVFPLIDYGLIQDNKQPSDLILPAFYLHTLLNVIINSYGYRITGLELIEEYRKIALPFTNEKPTNNGADWVADRQARVTVPPASPYSVSIGGAINTVLPFSVVDKPLSGFSQGTLQNFKPALYGYKCDSKMRLKVEVSISYKLKVSVGSVRVDLLIEKNGVEIDWAAQTETAIHDILFLARETLTYSGTITCEKDDVITVRLKVDNTTTFNTWFFEANRDETCFAVFAPDPVVQFNDFFPVAANLPDVTGMDLLKAVSFLFSGKWYLNDNTGELRFESFTQLVENRAGAVDWSDRVDESREGTLTPNINSYSLSNWLKWKEETETRIDAGKRGFGDGFIPGGAGADETTLFELPFASVLNSPRSVTGVETIPLLPIREAGKDGSAPTSKSISPRLILVHESEKVSVTTSILDGGNKFIDKQIKLRLCWWDKRPLRLQSESATSLHFEKLITKYYSGLTYVLKRPETINVSMYLRPTDISTINFNRLVRIQKKEAGSLRMVNGYYYLNKIDGYQPNQPTNVTLISV